MTQLLAKTNITPTPDVDTARTALGNMWDFIYEMLQAPPVDITCAATLDIGGKGSARLRITGTPVNITSFGTNYRGPIFITAANTYTIVHNATTLACRAGWWPSIAPGDAIIAIPKISIDGVADGWMVLEVFKMDGSGLFNTLSLRGAAPLFFDGATQGGYSTKVSVVDPTANRTITIPDANVDLTNVRDATTSVKGYGRVATWAEAQDGTINTNVFLTPDAFNWSRAFDIHGYMKWPGAPKFLINWGRTGSFNADTNGTLTFSHAFNPSGGVLGVVAQIHHSSTGNEDVVARVISYSTTQVTLRAEAVSAANSGSGYVLYYFAWGYA